MQKHHPVMCWCSMMDEKGKRTIIVRGLIIYQRRRVENTQVPSLPCFLSVLWVGAPGGAARPGGPAPSRCSGPAAVRDAAQLSTFPKVRLFCPTRFCNLPPSHSSAPENTSASATVATMPADGDFLWSCPLIGWQASNREQLVRGWCISECLHFCFQGCLVNARDPASGWKRRDGGNNLFSGRPQQKRLMNRDTDLTWIWRQESRGTKTFVIMTGFLSFVLFYCCCIHGNGQCVIQKPCNNIYTGLKKKRIYFVL